MFALHRARPTTCTVKQTLAHQSVAGKIQHRIVRQCSSNTTSSFPLIPEGFPFRLSWVADGLGLPRSAVYNVKTKSTSNNTEEFWVKVDATALKYLKLPYSSDDVDFYTSTIRIKNGENWENDFMALIESNRSKNFSISEVALAFNIEPHRIIDVFYLISPSRVIIHVMGGEVGDSQTRKGLNSGFWELKKTFQLQVDSYPISVPQWANYESNYRHTLYFSNGLNVIDFIKKRSLHLE